VKSFIQKFHDLLKASCTLGMTTQMFFFIMWNCFCRQDFA